MKLNDEHRDWIAPQGVADLVSVVMPTFNRSAISEQTLQCLLQQTYRPMEIIVVDDGSTDDTPAMVERQRAQAADGITLHYLQQRPSGAPRARNRGAMASQGEYVVFMDDDDLPAVDFVESRMQTIRLSGGRVNCAFGPWQRFQVSDGVFQIIDHKGVHPELDGGNDRRTIWTTFLRGWDLLLQGCVLHRKLVSEVGPWNTALLKGQDLDYKARLVSADCRPAYTDAGMVYYRLHENSISGQDTVAKLRSHVEVLDRIEEISTQLYDYPDIQTEVADYFWTQSFWLYGRGDFAGGRNELRRAKQHQPDICQRKGKLPKIFAALGLDGALGPLFYYSARAKSRLGMSKRQPMFETNRLPQPVASKVQE